MKSSPPDSLPAAGMAIRPDASDTRRVAPIAMVARFPRSNPDSYRDGAGYLTMEKQL